MYTQHKHSTEGQKKKKLKILNKTKKEEETEGRNFHLDTLGIQPAVGRRVG